jgi:hypothetical protein
VQQPAIIWFAWGGPEPEIDKLKIRFQRLSLSGQAFFYNLKHRQIVKSIPTQTEFAKHPQGLEGMPIVRFISQCL